MTVGDQEWIGRTVFSSRRQSLYTTSELKIVNLEMEVGIKR